MIDAGFRNERGFLVTEPPGMPLRTAPTRRLLLSARPLALYLGQPNIGELASERVAWGIRGAGLVRFEFIINPVMVGTPVWVPANLGFSVAEVSTHEDAAAGGFSNGTTAATWFGHASGAGNATFDAGTEFVVLRTPAAIGSIVQVISISAIALAGTPEIVVSMSWRERHPPF